ncbi:MAG: hypothetical protein ACRDQD_13300 [Nocardioidaceae bacterium]
MTEHRHYRHHEPATMQGDLRLSGEHGWKLVGTIIPIAYTA